MWYSFKRMVDDIMKDNKMGESKIENNITQTKEENDKKIDNNKSHNKSIKNFSTYEVILLVLMSLLIGLSIGGLLDKKNIITKEKITGDEHLKEFVENYEYIINNYYEEIDRASLINSAISGMMESLDDPYSIYFNEEESDNFSITLDGSYKGLGIQILKDEETGYMLVTSIFKNSPAAEAGLEAGDKIISIDNNNANEMTASQFSSLIRDSEQNEFNLKVLRNEETLEIKLLKSTVTLDSVLSKTFNIEDKKVGYIYIGIFANNTYNQFKEELQILESSGMDFLIIDVRGNTGGHLTAVDNILDLFLNSKQVMYQFEQNEEITTIYGNGDDNKNYEIVLLGDETSASASEVLIAGLRENLNSKLIGKKTYGKGTVQEMVTLSDGTQYKITVKKWLTPTGAWVNDTEGIIPDIEVDMDDNYYQTYSDDDDTQLQKALNYLKNR